MTNTTKIILINNKIYKLVGYILILLGLLFISGIININANADTNNAPSLPSNDINVPKDKNIAKVNQAQLKVNIVRDDSNRIKNSLDEKQTLKRFNRVKIQLNKERQINDASNKVQEAKFAVNHATDQHSRAENQKTLDQANDNLVKLTELDQHRSNLKKTKKKLGQSTNYEQLGEAQNQINLINHKIKHINKLF